MVVLTHQNVHHHSLNISTTTMEDKILSLKKHLKLLKRMLTHVWKITLTYVPKSIQKSITNSRELFSSILTTFSESAQYTELETPTQPEMQEPFYKILDSEMMMFLPVLMSRVSSLILGTLSSWDFSMYLKVFLYGESVLTSTTMEISPAITSIPSSWRLVSEFGSLAET